MVGPNAARLDLYPPFHRKHPVFSVSLLRKDTSQQVIPRFTTRRQATAAGPNESLAKELHNEDEVHFISDERLHRTPEGTTIREFLVRRTNYSSVNDVWVAEAKLQAPNRIREFRQERRTAAREQDRTARSDEEEVEYEVERIVGERRGARGKVEYLIKWTGYSSDHNSWEPAEYLKRSPAVLQEWTQLQPKCGRARLPPRRDRT